MTAKRRLAITYRAGWTGLFLLLFQGGAGAVTILPEGYDPSAPVLKTNVGLQEETLLPAPVPTEIPTREPKVIVTLRKPEAPLGPLICMNDVCTIECQDPELHEQLAAVDLAQAPPPGETTFIYPRRIEATLRKMGMGNGDFIIQGPDRVAVETDSQEISMEQIEEAVDLAFKARAREKEGREEVEVFLLHRPNPVHLPPGEVEIEVTNMDRPGSGIRNVQVAFRVDGREADTQTVPVRVHQLRKALVAARDLQAGKILTAKDLVDGKVTVMDKEPKNEPLNERSAVIGASLKVSLNEGEPISKNDIEWIPISKKGEPVSLVKKVGNVRLSLNGNLEEDLLYVGQEVKVRVRKTNKEVRGKAISDGTIQIN